MDDGIEMMVEVHLGTLLVAADILEVEEDILDDDGDDVVVDVVVDTQSMVDLCRRHRRLCRRCGNEAEGTCCLSMEGVPLSVATGVYYHEDLYLLEFDVN